MSQLEWQQVKEIFYQALSSPLESRREFLDSACGTDQSLRSQVEVLLDSYQSGFLETSLYDGLSQPAGPLLEPGKTFSHYTILKMLGRGGMGEVYLANDTALDRMTAIKVIHGESGFGDKAPQRLVREARAAAKLDHPNICSVYEVGEFDGQPFIAMQYIEGDMLDARIGAGTVTYDQAVTYTRQIAAALGKAHSWGIVHRDIKPSNIIIDVHGQIKVLDFGLAKETHAEITDMSVVGMIVGTVTYMSPEHLRGQEINGQTDIWSLGVVLYQMLTGRLPFWGETKADLSAAILNNEPELELVGERPLPPSAEYVIRRALEKDRSRRYATIEEMDADLVRLADGVAIEGDLTRAETDPLPASWPGLLPSSFPMLRLVLPVVVLLAVVAGVAGVWRYSSLDTVPRSFSAGTAGDLQITNLYSTKRQSGGAIINVSFSPDGQSIAFSMNGNDPSQIYVQRLSGGDPVRLTDGKYSDSTPVWSNDSQRVAYISVRDGKPSIRSVPASGGASAHLVELPGVRGTTKLIKWKNDGKSIWFDDSGLKEIDLVSGVVTRVDLSGISGKPLEYTLSFDESRLLVLTHEEGKLHLWVKSVGIADARDLGDVSLDGIPSWFRDNQRFAYSSGENGGSQIYVRDLDGASRQITFGNFDSTQPVVSPDGQRIVYISNFDEANVFVNDIAAGRESPVTDLVNLQLFPDLSPDADRVAYHTIRDSTKLTAGTVRVAPYPTGPATVIDNSGCCVRWIKGGKEVAFIRTTGTELNIFRAVPGEPPVQVSTAGVIRPSNTIAPFDLYYSFFELSPDGSKIAFISAKSGQANVWTVRIDGSDERMVSDLTDEGTQAFAPMWSPDGHRIAYLETVDKKLPTGSEHFRVSVYGDASIKTAAEFRSKTNLVGWSDKRNGVYVWVRNDNDLDIYFVALDGTQTVERTHTLANARDFGMVISPDGGWIGYTERVDNIDNICIVPMAGGMPKRVTANTDTTFFFSGVRWTPDSKSLLYSKQTGGMQISLISTHN